MPYIYRSQAKSGTCSFYAYATLYVIKKGKRLTLAIRGIRNRDINVAIITYLLASISSLKIEIKTLYCKQWLGHSQPDLKTDLTQSTDLDWHLWVANHIQDLFSLTIDVSTINISNSLTQIANKLTYGNIAALARYLEMPKSTVWLWCQGKNQPSFEALLIICYRLKINLVDLLTNNLDFLPVLSVSSQVYSLSSPIISTCKKTPTFNAVYAQQQLTKILNDAENTPISLEEAARRISCDRRTLSRHFPDLCREISCRYLSYRQNCYQQAVKQCCQEVEEAVRTLHQQGIYPTEVLVSQLISHPGYFRYKRVRKVFQKARVRLCNPRL